MIDQIAIAHLADINRNNRRHQSEEEEFYQKLGRSRLVSIATFLTSIDLVMKGSRASARSPDGCRCEDQAAFLVRP
jgi:hypothetical protein